LSLSPIYKVALHTAANRLSGIVDIQIYIYRAIVNQIHTHQAKPLKGLRLALLLVNIYAIFLVDGQ